MIPEDNKQEIDPFYQNLFDQAYNTGVEHCIEVIKNIYHGNREYCHSNTNSASIMYGDINQQLEQLKKPIQ